jgi:hypothetical protein
MRIPTPGPTRRCCITGAAPIGGVSPADEGSDRARSATPGALMR